MGLCCSSRGAPNTLNKAPPAPSVRRRSWPARIRSALAWALPITTLALIPKCPACVAGYVLLLTGFGVSLPMAGNMRLALIASAAIIIVWLLARSAIAALRRNTPVA